MPARASEIVQGNTYGTNWTILSRIGTRIVEARCSCGRIAQVSLFDIKNGKSTKCWECHKIALGLRRKTWHTETEKRLRRRAYGAIARCVCKTHPNYPDYGGRGIGVYPGWRFNARAFVDYLLTLPGHDDPTLTIDRINNNGNYEPGNLRFVTRREQRINQRPKGPNKPKKPASGGSS